MLHLTSFKKPASCLLLLFTMHTAFAQQNEALPLYKTVPNSKPTPATYKETVDARSGIRNVSQPTLLPFFPEKGKANGTAIVICPGGGYAMLAFGHEGVDVAKKFAENGITAFVLKYRLPSDQIMKDRSIAPLQDAQRALQMVRENAAKWNIDPTKVGIMGFSAGGHLASTATTHFDKPVIDVKPGESVRPDFSMLIYPVISMGQYTHQSSKEFLIGKDAPAEKVKLYSNEFQVTANTPPVFLVHAQDDGLVPAQNSMLFYDALINNKVKGALYMYQAGGHGFGMNNRTTTDAWFENGLDWLKLNKFL
ncbi:alpha/beta hydrolase [Flavobacterium sp. RHBU_24]|uniref:alpha/beta hydrolase n=1 Tax=Flavobacterium sp. RHBU_24 TaxID=3391185 RepID=UPI0039849B4D